MMPLLYIHKGVKRIKFCSRMQAGQKKQKNNNSAANSQSGVSLKDDVRCRDCCHEINLAKIMQPIIVMWKGKIKFFFLQIKTTHTNIRSKTISQTRNKQDTVQPINRVRHLKSCPIKTIFRKASKRAVVALEELQRVTHHC